MKKEERRRDVWPLQMMMKHKRMWFATTNQEEGAKAWGRRPSCSNANCFVWWGWVKVQHCSSLLWCKLTARIYCMSQIMKATVECKNWTHSGKIFTHFCLDLAWTQTVVVFNLCHIVCFSYFHILSTHFLHEFNRSAARLTMSYAGAIQ